MQKNYWPVIGHPTTYAMMTSILKKGIDKFIECKKIFPLEQKGCKKKKRKKRKDNVSSS